MNKRFFGLCAAVLVCADFAAQAQHNDSTTVQRLDEVVVSDSRFALKRENSGKTVIKIGSKTLERYQGKNVAEIINAKSGLEIGGSRSREGAVFGVFARGGRGRQVLIIVDGVRVSDPSSSSSEYDLRMVSTADVESIEIIKGAASTLYGSNAATAVINIVTKKAATDAIAGSFQSSVGTNQTSGNQNYNLSRSSNSARVSGTLGNFSYLARVSNRYAEGLSDLITPQNEKDGFSHLSTGFRLGYSYGKKIDVSIYADQTKFRTDYDESYGLLDAPYQFLSQQERLGTSVKYSYEKGSIHMNAAYAVYNSENISAFPSEYEGSNYNLDLYHKYDFNNQFYTLIGLNYLEDRTEFAGQEKFHLIDPYLNAVFVSDFGLNVNAGARLNNHSTYRNNFVYNLNPSFLLKHHNGYYKILTSYATSYITPSLTQLYGNFGANPDLQPENDRTLEAGFEYSKTGELRLSTLYFNRTEDHFVFYDLETGSYKNALNPGYLYEKNFTVISFLLCFCYFQSSPCAVHFVF